MLGDYQGIAESTGPNVPAVPVWIDTRTGNPDPYVTRVGIAPQVNFTSWQAARLSLGQINNPQTGGEAGDADGDGEDNLSEFQRGTEPNDPLSVFRSARPLNISTRAVVGNDENVLIGGFIITGPDSKRVIARAIGPTLTQFGVANALDDPTLELVPQNSPRIFNNDWQDTDAATIQATGRAPSDPRESAIVQTLAPGSYTAIVRSRNLAPGTGLVELYDLAPETNARFGNLSSRGRIFPGEHNVMIGGVIVGAGDGVGGAGSTKVVVRAIGPTLAAFDIADPVQDPELLVVDANANIVASNDNWRTGPSAGELVALQLAPNDDREGALVATLQRGNYTAIVRGVGQSTGVGLVEVYYVPPMSQ
jgi:hypothetical protein